MDKIKQILKMKINPESISYKDMKNLYVLFDELIESTRHYWDRKINDDLEDMFNWLWERNYFREMDKGGLNMWNRIITKANTSHYTEELTREKEEEENSKDVGQDGDNKDLTELGNSDSDSDESKSESEPEEKTKAATASDDSESDSDHEEAPSKTTNLARNQLFNADSAKTGIRFTNLSNLDKLTEYTNYLSVPVLEIDEYESYCTAKDFTTLCNLVSSTDDMILRLKFHTFCCLHYGFTHYLFTKEYVDGILTPLLNESKLTSVTMYWMNYANYILDYEEYIDKFRYTYKTGESGNRHRLPRWALTDEQICRFPNLSNYANGISEYPFIHIPIKVMDNPYAYIPFHLTGSRHVTPREESLKKLKWATKGALEYIDFDNIPAVVTGSIMCECASHNPKLEHYKKTHNIFDGGMKESQFTDYLTKYYISEYLESNTEGVENMSTSDVDIAIIVEDNHKIKFIRYANTIIDNIRENIDNPEELTVNPINSSGGVKYRVFHPTWLYPLELFCVFKHPAKLVKDFYIANVRTYYDGKQIVYIKSAWTSHAIGISGDIRWISNNKVPADPIIKNMQRGYTVVLNNKQLTAIVAYMYINPRWSSFLGITGILGPFTVESNSIFTSTSHGIWYNQEDDTSDNIVEKLKAKYKEIVENVKSPNVDLDALEDDIEIVSEEEDKTIDKNTTLTTTKDIDIDLMNRIFRFSNNGNWGYVSQNYMYKGTTLVFYQYLSGRLQPPNINIMLD
jgi:hypothetical protein